jgi:hypothetical protein
MEAEDHALMSVADPEGREIVLLARIWNEKIALDHPELAGQQEMVRAAVEHPDHVEPDVLPSRTRFYRRTSAPSRWLLVVVSYEQGASADHHRAGQPQGSQAMEAMNIHIGPLVFDHADYDDTGDVLYLHVGPPQPGEGEETPEGHVIRFAPGTQRIIGLTVINARHVLERDGRLVVTVPETVEASAAELAPALQAA